MGQQSQEQEINYTKLNTELYLPGLLNITNLDKHFPWVKIDRDFTRLKDIKEKNVNDGIIKVDTTLFFTILAAKIGHSQAIGMLHFLNIVFEELGNRLDEKEQKMICSTIKKIVSTFDPRFYNFVGEIAVLNCLTKSGIYRLEKVEAPLAIGGSIDFQLFNKEKNSSTLVEVMNIHLDSEKVDENSTAINKFFTDRFSAKIKKKSKGMPEYAQFHLVPVLWGGAKELQVYKNHFKTNQLGMDYVIEPFAYLQHTDGTSFYDHQFSRVSALIDKTGHPRT
jgi:hypothetical protein